MHSHAVEQTTTDSALHKLRLLFWETTTACNLNCVHCRACPEAERSPEDMSTQEGKALLDQIAEFSQAAVVLSGGEPLVRPDILEFAAYGTDKGLRMLLATNGTMLNDRLSEEIRDSGIQRVAVSIDGADAATHDLFRQQAGAFESAWRGIRSLVKAGLPYQLNTSVGKHNLAQIPQILKLAEDSGACALHLFLLVPTGCGKQMPEEEMISAAEYERLLNWLIDQTKQTKLQLKATCAPHFQRILLQRAESDPSLKSQGIGKGCLAGSSVCFVSHRGEVFPCGYLPVIAGNVRERSLEDIWEEAEVFRVLREPDNLEGKCGRCEYGSVCMGCRARAYGITGNYLAAEPFCAYKPGAKPK